MKLLRYLVLVGLNIITACKNPLTSSESNPALNSSVTFKTTPASKIVKLDLLEATTIKKTVDNTANLELSVLMNVAVKRSFTARVTKVLGCIAELLGGTAICQPLTVASRLPLAYSGQRT